jgi:hypothetical protein
MAGEQEIRPVDVQIARPVQAPNYVGMYSEAIKGALAPYEYLMNYQKELSEEDYRKAEIQNFLAEHDLKNRELSETVRAHTATEAIQNLQRQQEDRRLDETSRHNLVDEAHQKTVDERESARDAETARHQNFIDLMAVKREDLQKSLDEATIAKSGADTEYLHSEAARIKGEQDRRDNDQQVMQGFNTWFNSIKPEDLYNSSEKPEIQRHINETLDKLQTVEGRAQFDHIYGEGTALGREISERKEYNAFTREGKAAFQTNMLNSDKGQPTQVRFENAMNDGRIANQQAVTRLAWSAAGTKAYSDAKAKGASDMDAYTAGLTAEEQAQAAIKRKEEKPDPKLVDQWKAAVQKKPGEDETHFEARSSQVALDIEMTRIDQGATAAHQKLLEYNRGQLGGATGESAVKKLKQMINAPETGPMELGSPLNAPGTQATPAVTMPPMPGMTPPGVQQLPGTIPGTMQPPLAGSLALGASPLLPGAIAPTFAAATGTEDLAKEFNQHFGLTEEEPATV